MVCAWNYIEWCLQDKAGGEERAGGGRGGCGATGRQALQDGVVSAPQVFHQTKICLLNTEIFVFLPPAEHDFCSAIFPKQKLCLVVFLLPITYPTFFPHPEVALFLYFLISSTPPPPKKKTEQETLSVHNLFTTESYFMIFFSLCFSTLSLWKAIFFPAIVFRLFLPLYPVFRLLWSLYSDYSGHCIPSILPLRNKLLVEKARAGSSVPPRAFVCCSIFTIFISYQIPYFCSVAE
jgi:hypothetical protein